MSTINPVYLLAGGRSGNHRSMARVFRSIFQDIRKEKPLIAYVGVASGDNWGFYLMISGMLNKYGSCRIERIMIAPRKADLGKAKDSLNSADAIFMSGGDVEVGMKVLEEKNLIGYFKDLYQQGKLFFGTSAGSIMLAKEWIRWRDPDDDSTAELFPCLDIVPMICDTHAEEDGWEELKAALNLLEPGASGYGIPSGACLKVYPDGTLAALGHEVYCYTRQREGIRQTGTLKPEVPDR
jgi:peptidase E